MFMLIYYVYVYALHSNLCDFLTVPFILGGSILVREEETQEDKDKSKESNPIVNLMSEWSSFLIFN